MTQPTIKTLFTSAGAAALLAGGSLFGGDYGKAIIDDKVPIEPWSICDVFDYNTLYEGDGFIRGVSLHGRYHGQYISQREDVNGVRDNGYHAWQHRRARLGIEIEAANGLTFYAEFNYADNEALTKDSFINDFQDFYIEWEPENAPVDGLFIRVGKQKLDFTLEDAESSKRIKTVERSHIVNETAGARPWGAVVGFETGDFEHVFGGWLFGAHADNPEWVDFQSNGGFSYNLFYDLNDSTTLHFDYLYADNDGGLTGSEGQAANGLGPEYEHAIALGAEVESGRFQMITDFIYGANRSSGGGIPAGNDTWGFYVLPSYDITDNLEFVFRYAYMDEGRNQRTQRFPARQPVENYHTFYTGFQYFICGEKLKVMGGYEYATGDVFQSPDELDSGSWLFAVRSYF